MKHLQLVGAMLGVVCLVTWSIFCALLPVAIVLWNLGEWEGEAFVVPPGNAGTIIAAVLLGNVTGITGFFFAARVMEKLTGE